MITNDSAEPGPRDLLEALADLAADPADLSARLYAYWCTVPAVIGDVYVAFTDRGSCYVRTTKSMHGDDRQLAESFRERFHRPLRMAHRPPAGLRSSLRTGRLRGLDLDLRGLTDFEQSVLHATTRIPPGQTRFYGWIAEQVGRPGAARAVSTVLHRNPVPLLVPCHRVICSNGEPGGYVFGREAKERLLLAEKVDLAEVRRLASQQVFYLGSDTTNIVCFPTCPHARRITQPHRKGFRSIDQAAQAGYRPCLHCRPWVMAG